MTKLEDLIRRITSDGDIDVHVKDESTIHLRVVSDFGDPVELLPIQARTLAEVLLKLADDIDKLDSEHDWAADDSKN